MGNGTYYVFILIALAALSVKTANSAPFCFTDVGGGAGQETASGIDCATGEPVTVKCTITGTIIANPDCTCDSGGGAVNLPTACCLDSISEDMVSTIQELKQQVRDIQSTIKSTSQLMNFQCK